MNIDTLKIAALRHPTEIMEPYDQIMEQAGFDSVYAFAEHLGGLTIYVPKPKSIFFRCLEMEAIGEYTGKNTKILAQKYGFTERHMRRIVGNS